MLKIEHLTKRYGEKKAVDDLSLHIAPGEVYGCIDEGEIKIGGKSIRTDPIACKQMMAYIPDNPDLYEFLSGIKYLNFIADIYGVGKKEREERIRRYADVFGLTADLAQPISEYSHGMKQKLAIISAWLHQRRRDLLLDARAGGRGKALRQGRHHQGRTPHRLRHDGGGQGRPVAGGRVPGAGGRRQCLSRC